ncbi:MAG: hypothetical protein IH830_04265 [Planctomycetes bacterium]|nr:hypothetical protein [Planctomycetota bacterium]
MLAGSLLTAFLLPGAAAWGQCTANELTKLTASDAAAGDEFGISVASSGDVAAVGARFDDDNGIDSGSAYVFRWNGSAWLQEAKLIASDGSPGDQFGFSVSISGDVALMGAFRDDDSGTDSGSAYMFRWNGWSWVQEAKLTASDGAADDFFGFSVAVSGELAVVGAVRDEDACLGYPNSNPNCNTGSAYVFKRPAGGWVDMTETAKLTASDGGVGDEFGFSVAVYGEVAVVGARLDDDNGQNSGSAYVFVKPPGGWVDMTETAKLTASDGAAIDLFGSSVGLSGDMAVVGAHLHDVNRASVGSAYVFEKPAGGWVDMTETAKLTASDGTAGDKFGFSVAVSGNVTVITAVNDDDNGVNSGSAYVFRFDGTDWIEEAKLTASDGAPSDDFGLSVAVNGDVAVVGAFWDDDNGGQSGSVHVFGGLSDCNDNGVLDLCDIADGTSTDANANGVPDECECPWDLDGDGGVGILDLLALVAAWGTDPGGPPDFDGDGIVGILDLLILLANWGPCP